jgi:hypothetical protein
VLAPNPEPPVYAPPLVTEASLLAVPPVAIADAVPFEPLFAVSIVVALYVTVATPDEIVTETV